MMFFIRYIWIFTTTSLLVVSIAGCFQPQTPQEKLSNGLKQGKSIVIMPKPYKRNIEVIWGKEGDNTRNQYFNNGFLVGDDYMAFLIDAGKYYIQNMRIKSNRDLYPEYLFEINSTLSDTILYKTPQKKFIRYFDKNSNLKSKKVDIESYYEFIYSFDIANKNHIGTISIGSREIILVPLIWMDVKFYENSCKTLSKEENSFLMKIFNSVENNLFFALLDAGSEENGFHAWIWSCKTNGILVAIKTSNINSFLLRDDIKDFLGTLPNQQITTRNFEFNEIFKNAEKIENFEENFERYIIHGNTSKQ
ncbi:MAG: hypothetical protein LBS39_01970 [Campylobacteraceae bacterium]|jgi:hypothetical protein|nr:hypothetical protein [Campylobacteraceae bacterium]